MKILIFLLAISPVQAQVFPQKDGFYLDSKNLKIESDCNERIPVRDLSRFYHQTMSEGRKCLDTLSIETKSKPKINLCFDQLFADRTNPPKLLCGSWPFGKEIGAVGSFPGSSKRHPYLWLGPKSTELYLSNHKELKSIIFHEMIHNCGYLHSEGIELAYTCEECCFNNKLSVSKKESACRICSGIYSDEFNLDYQRDLLNWSRAYVTWGRDMRRSVFMAATKNKNIDSFELLLSEIIISEKEKGTLRTLFLTPNKPQQQNLIAEFEKLFAASLEKNEKLAQLIEWFKISLQ